MILLFNVCEELFLVKATLVKWHGQFVCSVQVANPHTRTTAKSDMTCNETDRTQSKVGVSAGYKEFRLPLKHYHLRSTGLEVGNCIGFLSDKALQYQHLRREPEPYYGMLSLT